MGNNVATGHIVALAGPGTLGFEKTVQQLMRIHNIQPWSAKELLEETLQKQLELSKVSPLRYIGVAEGFSHYRQYVGSWTTTLTRERFVEITLDLFRKKHLRLPLDEQKMLYDVFDSIDLYHNATLSCGELSGGLSGFFGGDLNERTVAIFDALAHQPKFGALMIDHHPTLATGPQHAGQLSNDALKSFLKPYMWCMVPAGAEVLRPIFLEYVAEELFYEIACDSFERKATHISLPQMQHWMSATCSAAAHVAALSGASPSAIPADAVVEKAAISIDMAVRKACIEYEHKQALRDYGKQTWSAQHGGQQQRMMDVGAGRYVYDKLSSHSTPRAPHMPELLELQQPSLWTTLSEQSSALLESTRQAAYAIHGDIKEGIRDTIAEYYDDAEEMSPTYAGHDSSSPGLAMPSCSIPPPSSVVGHQMHEIRSPPQAYPLPPAAGLQQQFHSSAAMSRTAGAMNIMEAYPLAPAAGLKQPVHSSAATSRTAGAMNIMEAERLPSLLSSRGAMVQPGTSAPNKVKTQIRL